MPARRINNLLAQKKPAFCTDAATLRAVRRCSCDSRPRKLLTVQTYKEANCTYPRWSEERMKQEKAADRQETKLTRQVAPFMAGDKQMEFGFGMDQLEANLETPKAKANRGKAKAAIHSRWDRKAGQT